MGNNCLLILGYLTIRKGVKFHDGSSLTASDIAFSINRAKTAPSDMVDLIKSVKSAKAIDDNTVEIKTEGPNPILLNQLNSNICNV